jgi:hypothetical protein
VSIFGRIEFSVTSAVFSAPLWLRT